MSVYFVFWKKGRQFPSPLFAPIISRGRSDFVREHRDLMRFHPITAPAKKGELCCFFNIDDLVISAEIAEEKKK